MKFETRFGTLELPRDDCISCIYTGKYMSCSMCELRWGIIEDATEPFYARQRAVQGRSE